MHLSDEINPKPEQLEKLLETFPKNSPVVMINILRYRSQTDDSSLTGKEAYELYSLEVMPLLKAVGGTLLWKGKLISTVIGDDQNQADAMLLVKYPSTDHFFQLINNPEYKKVSHFRSIALEYGGLFSAVEEYSKFDK